MHGYQGAFHSLDHQTQKKVSTISNHAISLVESDKTSMNGQTQQRRQLLQQRQSVRHQFEEPHRLQHRRYQRLRLLQPPRQHELSADDYLRTHSIGVYIRDVIKIVLKREDKQPLESIHQ